jgi:hypothetical protein
VKIPKLAPLLLAFQENQAEIGNRIHPLKLHTSLIKLHGNEWAIPQSKKNRGCLSLISNMENQFLAV